MTTLPTTKAIMRVIHFISISLLAGNLMQAFSVGFISGMDKWVKISGMVAGVGLVISGFINWFLLKNWKTTENKVPFTIWTAVIHSKLLLVLIIFSPLPKLVLQDENVIWLRASVFGIFLVVTPFMRMNREVNTPLVEGVKEL